MSENILIGKSRKTGKWEIIVNPADGYDACLKAYQKIAANLPVNDDYSKVLLGRIQNTSTPLTLLTADENKARKEALETVVDRASSAGADAEARQKEMEGRSAEAVLERRRAELDEKNALVNRVRKDTGQSGFTKTTTEQSIEDLRERLAKQPAADKDEAAEDSQKTKDELLAEKNAITDATKKASDTLNQQRETAEADKSARVDKLKK